MKTYNLIWHDCDFFAGTSYPRINPNLSLFLILAAKAYVLISVYLGWTFLSLGKSWE